jgi:hypothetical protein
MEKRTVKMSVMFGLDVEVPSDWSDDVIYLKTLQCIALKYENDGLKITGETQMDLEIQEE